MVITHRARLLILCAVLAVPALGSALADPAIKPAITGLVSTGSAGNTLNQINNDKFKGTFGGLVVQATWAGLQPNGPSDFVTTGIDDALDAIRKYNGVAANKRKIGVRLRVFSGCTDNVSDAPQWAMNLDSNDGGVLITGPYNGGTETCLFGRFWDPASGYAAAWQQLQTKLAARYDTEPLIREVAVTSCTSFSAEPFFIPTLSGTMQTYLQNVGYSDAAYQQCLENAVAVYAPWQTTRLEFSFNPFYRLTSPTVGDFAFSERVMRGCRQAAGQRCILSNHDLDTQTPSSILPIYALERKFGPNITFQTYHVNPTDFEGTIRKSVSLGAGSIEVWQEPNGFEAQSGATLQNWASMFEPQ